MLDLISVSAISAVLTTIATGTLGEAGKSVWVVAGGVVRRIAGREVAAPTTAGQLDAVARLLYERTHADPQLALAWRDFARDVPWPGVPERLRRPSLPNTPRYFTDREEAMRLLDQEATRPHDGRPRLALLHGRTGIGTSTLAVHWGWRQADRFPDGQLYVDLRALGPDAALAHVLRQLGLPEEEMPAVGEGRADVFRRWVADRRLLLVLDHVRSTAQLTPLLTSAPGVFTLVVAGQPLTGLGALTIPVGPLAKRDAKQLMSNVAGEPAVKAARRVLPAVLERCAGSPYALHAAALRLLDPPGPSETSTVPESDPVLAAVEDSYRLLSPAAARLYRLAGLRDWPALAADAAARAADIDGARATDLLEELTAALLIESTGGRYRYRPAVRAHAERTAATVDGIPVCSAAVTRVVGGYRDLAVAAARSALPESWRVPSAVLAQQTTHASKGAAVATLIAEAPNLVEAVHTAVEYQDWDTVALLGQALWPLQLKAGCLDVVLPALRAAARVADERFTDRKRTVGALHFQLAHCLMESGRWEEAETETLAAVDAERAAGHARGHASAVELLGLLRLRQWRYEEAYDRFEEAYGIYDTIGPQDEGARDLPRARALLDRHRGAALGHLGRPEQAVEYLERARAFFRDPAHPEAYNLARTVTDLAAFHLDAGAPRLALPLVDEALAALGGEHADFHVARLRALRERCLTPE